MANWARSSARMAWALRFGDFFAQLFQRGRFVPAGIMVFQSKPLSRARHGTARSTSGLSMQKIRVAVDRKPGEERMAKRGIHRSPLSSFGRPAASSFSPMRSASKSGSWFTPRARGPAREDPPRSNRAARRLAADVSRFSRAEREPRCWKTGRSDPDCPDHASTRFRSRRICTRIAPA